MSKYTKVIETAIERERKIIGDRAEEIAGKNNIKLDNNGKVESVEGEGRKVLRNLVNDYKNIGGNVTLSLIAKEIEKLEVEDLELPKELDERVRS